jgi:hypothetical protein
MSIPSAICINCGVSHYGWSLRYGPRHACSKCGAPLGVLSFEGESASQKPVGERKANRSDKVLV